MEHNTKLFISRLLATQTFAGLGLYFTSKQALDYLVGETPRLGQVLFDTAVPLLTLTSILTSYVLYKNWKSEKRSKNDSNYRNLTHA